MKLFQKISAILAFSALFAAASQAQVVDQSYTNLAQQASFQYQTPGFTTLTTITDMSFGFQLYNPNGAAPSAGGTNKPLFSISVSPTVGQSNACVCTNVPRTLLGSHGWIQLQQIQNLSTNVHLINIPNP